MSTEGTEGALPPPQDTTGAKVPPICASGSDTESPAVCFIIRCKQRDLTQVRTQKNKLKGRTRTGGEVVGDKNRAAANKPHARDESGFGHVFPELCADYRTNDQCENASVAQRSPHLQQYENKERESQNLRRLSRPRPFPFKFPFQSTSTLANRIGHCRA